MEQSSEFNLDHTVSYSREHTWARIEDHHVTVGISDYAQDQLGEIIFVGLPEPDEDFSQDEVFGFVESVKTASDLYIPVSGKVIAINNELEDEPERVNNDPYNSGWMIKVLPTDRSQLDTLMKSQEYLNMLTTDSSTE